MLGQLLYLRNWLKERKFQTNAIYIAGYGLDTGSTYPPPLNSEASSWFLGEKTWGASSMTSLRLFHMASEVVWDTQGVFFLIWELGWC